MDKNGSTEFEKIYSFIKEECIRNKFLEDNTLVDPDVIMLEGKDKKDE